jgi:hypothetical protein
LPINPTHRSVCCITWLINIQQKTKKGFKKNVIHILAAAFFLLISPASFAQAESKDFKDVVAQWKKNPVPKINNELVVGKTYYSILPVIGYGPANGFVFGGAISFAHLFGNPPTNLSTGMLNFQVTTKKQFIVNARSKIYLSENNWFLQGDWRLLLFTQPTYGLGIDNSELNKIQIHVNNLDETGETWGEPMKFKLIRFYEEASRQLGRFKVLCRVGDCH